MENISLIPLFAPLLLAVLFTAIIERLTQRKRLPYPPGPKPLPIIGNLLDVRAIKEQGPDYLEWGRRYKSDILFSTVLGSHVLILNKQEDADEIFERRARYYSDRPQTPVLRLIGWEGMLSLIRYGDYWRKCRKILHQHFNHDAAKKIEPVIQENVHNFLADLVRSPSALQAHNHMLSVSFAMKIMYGYKVKDSHDPMIEAADKSLAIGGVLFAPEGTIMHFLPFLAYIPPWLAGPMTSRKIVAEACKSTRFLRASAKEFAVNSCKNGTAVSSIVIDFMEKHSINKASEEDQRAIEDVAFTTYAGATDTTIAVTKTFFYLMAKHPEVQRKAQAEIDQVIGTERLPRFEDRSSLPYIEAIYRELMRWTQSLPLAIAHSSTEDDVYKGYFIPKGTIVYGNVWAMTHDENIFEDPHLFIPERFFDQNGKLDKNDRILAYGFGRRICAGKAVASSVSWFMMVSSLACFIIGKEKDEFDNEVPLNDEYHNGGLLLHKKDYRCSIVPRSAVHKDLIAAEHNRRD